MRTVRLKKTKKKNLYSTSGRRTTGAQYTQNMASHHRPRFLNAMETSSTGERMHLRFLDGLQGKN